AVRGVPEEIVRLLVYRISKEGNAQIELSAGFEDRCEAAQHSRGFSNVLERLCAENGVEGGLLKWQPRHIGYDVQPSVVPRRVTNGPIARNIATVWKFCRIHAFARARI